MRERLLRTDWAPFVAGLGLSLVGAVLIWSATHDWAGPALAVRHLVNTAIGLMLGLAVICLDVRWLRAAAPWVYLLGLAGLVLVLTPLGQTVNGSRSWLFLPGGFSLQPAELAKIGLVVGLAMILAEGRDPYARPGWRDVLPAWCLAGVPIGLIMLQPDLGSGLVLGVLTLVVVATSGASWRWTATAVVAVCAVVVAAVRIPLLDPYQVDRLLAFRDPGLDPEGIGYQTHQARLAIGSGGWSGTGLGEGPQTQGGFIPYQYTDFIFSVAGEELGFVGASGLLVLLGFLVVRGLVVALHCEDPFGRLLAVGVASWFGFQIFENVGMNLGLMPVTGLPLPFLSYGGSSMLACWLALGLLACASGRDGAARSSWRARPNLPR